MMRSKGIVVEKGSVLSHTAIIGRELGIPTIVGAEAATQIIPDNCNLQMNGRTGVVQWQ
jgi:pyruvate,water dikinase